MSCDAEHEVIGGLRSLVIDMCAAVSRRATVRLIQRHPVLLTDAAVDVLAELTEEAEDDDPAVRAMFALHRDLLVRARESNGDNTRHRPLPDWLIRNRLMDARESDDVRVRLDRASLAHLRARESDHVRLRLDRALLACEIAKSGEGLAEDVQYAVEQLAGFLAAPRKDRMHALAQRPLVLHHGMPLVVEELAALQDDQESAEQVRRCKPFLARCREAGAVRALAEQAAREYLSAADDDERTYPADQALLLREGDRLGHRRRADLQAAARPPESVV
ncbi:hypothetical protein GCM10022416_48460 [Actinomadura keratinilytica]|jgi:hypothetical protein|uniref:DUF222 domain-containing protein n=1 Tax=Actinomadura keratinilytica TaxID=547461 RepID=A0ABP7ZAB4_9ACTN